jgi:DNA topoisomerase I
MAHQKIDGSPQEKRLYDLIWKRAIASQMSDAQLEKTTVTIDISTAPEKFLARGEVLKFDGFLKVYIESTDREQEEEGEEAGKGLLPALRVKDLLQALRIEAAERFTQSPLRYTEASLVKKLEELGIGRPSTYAPTISTIQQRGYVVKEDREGVERQYHFFSLEKGKIQNEIKTEVTGNEKNKLFPTDIGMVVTDFLVKHFEQIMDYNFTASIEEEFDEIAEGRLIWHEMIDRFYKPFHKKVVDTTENSGRNTGERKLGIDPKTGKNVYVRIGRYGPMAQLGESNNNKDDETAEKPRFAKLRQDQRLETISLEEALVLFKLPRALGQYEGHEVTVAIGRFGPYVRHNNAFFSLKKGVDDPFSIQLERAIELIEEKREADRKKIIKVFAENQDLRVLNGRWGPYISYKKENYKIPKTTDPSTLTLEDCMKLIEGGKSKSRGSRFRKKK